MKNVKNICITINSLGAGGAEKQCLLLAKALKQYHNIVLVILNTKPVYEPRLEIIEKENIPHIYLSNNPIKKVIGFTSLLKKRKIDIIFSFLPKDTALSAICGKIANVPFKIGGIRNSEMAWIKFLALRFFNNHLLDYTIANNYAAYHSSHDFGFRNTVFVIHNGIEIRPYQKRPKSEKNKITIISLGRLVNQKDYETALKSIAHLKQLLNKKYILKYKIVGQGPEQSRLINKIKKHGLVEEVELITDASEIYDLLETSDIYLCTSMFEGLSNSIMEAMNSGLPIVATDAGDNSRLVINNSNGFVTPIGFHEELAQNLRLLIEKPDLREEIGLASHTHLKHNFSYQAFQEKYLKIIENIDKVQIQNGEPIMQKSNSIK